MPGDARRPIDRPSLLVPHHRLGRIDVSFDLPLVSPVLVGRSAPLAGLERVLGEVAKGHGQTVLIGGEAGIGKSRLVAAARTRGERLGFTILEGFCFEPDGVLPYAPFRDLLRTRSGALAPDGLALEFGSAVPEIAQLLPELAALLPGFSPTRVHPEQEKHRVVHALDRYVAGLAAARPTLVVLEDLHWSDEASLDLLLSLARKTATRPLLLMLTYRTDEAHLGLRHFLAELDRGRLATELPLTPLSVGEVGEMVRAILAQDRPVGAAFLRTLYALTEGNPFFVEEVLGSLVAAGDIYPAAEGWERQPIDRLRIPRSIRDAVLRRAARVGEVATQILQLAAVAGRRFDFALLQELSGRDETDLLRAVKALIEVQLLVESSAETFAFRHALTREAIYGELLAWERKWLHGHIAAALERRDLDVSDAHLGDLAYHCVEAGEWAKALEYARAAGERAQALGAPRSAVEQFTRALAAADALQQPPAPEILSARARAYDLLGEFEAASADYGAALLLAEAAADQRGVCQALLDLAALWASRDYDRALDYLRRALALARSMDDPALLAHVLNRMGNWYANHEHPVPAHQHHAEALAIFERLDDRQGIAATLDLLGMAAALGGDLVAAVSALARAAALFHALGDAQGLVGCLANVGSNAICEQDVLVGAESLAETIRGGEQALTLAREIDWLAGTAFALMTLGESYAAAGDVGRGLELLREGLAIAEEIEHRQWMTQAHVGLGGVHADLLALPKARLHFEQVVVLGEALRSRLWSTIAVGRLASVQIAQGELDAAEEALAEFDAGTPMRTAGQRLLWCARAELALARDDPTAALAILDGLYAAAANLTGEGDIPRLARLKAQALASLGRTEESIVLLQAARSVAADQGARSELWRLHAMLAALLREQGRGDEAGREEAAARQLIASLASTVPGEELREQFVRAATARLPTPTAVSARRAAKAAFGGLTVREREVATLIAHGQTNRAIAEALSVSERTIDAHVGNMLRKLGFASRSQIAAWAVERGLSHPGT